MQRTAMPGRWVGVLAVVGALVCGWCWTVSSPVQGSPDEDYHLTSIWCANGSTKTCRPAPRSADGQRQVVVPGLVGYTFPCFAFKPQQPASCQDDYPRTVVTARVDSGNYPPGYYRTMHLFVGSSIMLSVLLMRAFNLVLAVVLMTAIYLASKPECRRQQVYVITCVGVPFGWYLVASVNPSGWAVTGIAACGFGLHAVLARLSRYPALSAAAALTGVVMAVEARGDAAVYVVLVALALCILHWRALRRRSALLALPAVIVGVGVFAFLRSPQVANVAASSPVATRSAQEEIQRLLTGAPSLITALFGDPYGLGWVDVKMPPPTSLGALAVVVTLVALGLRARSRSKVVALLFIALAMFGLPLWSLYRQRLDVDKLQARYLYPLLPILVMLAISGVRSRTALTLSRLQAWVIYLVLVIAQAAALSVNTHRYVVGLGIRADASPHWWWPHLPDPTVICIAGSAGFALFALLLVRHSNVQLEGGGARHGCGLASLPAARVRDSEGRTTTRARPVANEG